MSGGRPKLAVIAGACLPRRAGPEETTRLIWTLSLGALGLGRGRKVEVLLSVGYPAENPAPRPRKSREDYSSYNKP